MTQIIEKTTQIIEKTTQQIETLSFETGIADGNKPKDIYLKKLQKFQDVAILKQISRYLIVFVMVILIGITTAVPANAAAQTQLFNSNQVRLGITPTGWSNSDDLTMDLNPPISYKQIISEIALSGFKGTQGAPKFPKDVAVLKKDLEDRGLTISEPWVGTYFTIGAADDSQKIFENQMAFMKNFDSNVIVVAELGGAVHQQPTEPLANRPIFTNDQWDALTEGLNSLGMQAAAQGMVLCYHPHIGTGVETLADIKRLMSSTDDSVKLLLDTGHLYYAGVSQNEILALIKTYGQRIKHVHLKNIRQDILNQAKAEELSFLDAIRAGVFTVPGDDAGIIKFEPIFQALANADYKGWLMVEAEQDPSNTTIKPLREPLEYALMARNYLHQVTGL